MHDARMASTENQTTMMGPKNFATLAVPRFCTQNSAMRMPSASMMTFHWFWNAD